MGSIKKQGIRNAIIIYSGVIIGFVSLIFIQPNLLNPEELGLTRILIAGASLIASILPMGVTVVTAKFFPLFRNEEKKHHGFFGLMILFPIVGALFCGILVYAFKDIIIQQYIQQSLLFTQFFNFLLPFAIIISFNMALNAYSASLFKTTLTLLFEGVITRILFILLLIIYYLHWINLIQFMYLFVAIYLLQSIAMIIYIYAIDKPSLKIDKSHVRLIGTGMLIKFGLLFTLAGFSSISLKHLDTIMIGKYLSLESVGIFSVAAYLALVIEIPLTSLERITNFKVSQAWANKDVESIKSIYYQSVKYLMLLGGLLMIGIILNIHELLSLLPAVYQSGESVAKIACIGGFLNIATGVNTSILFTSDKYKYGTYLLFFLFVLAFVLNMLFIPTYGILGAAIATALSAGIYNLLKYLIILKNFKMQPFNGSSLKIILVILTVFTGCYFLPSFDNVIVSMLFKSGIITIIYLGLTYSLNIVPEFHKYIPFIKSK